MAVIPDFCFLVKIRGSSLYSFYKRIYSTWWDSAMSTDNNLTLLSNFWKCLHHIFQCIKSTSRAFVNYFAAYFRWNGARHILSMWFLLPLFPENINTHFYSKIKITNIECLPSKCQLVLFQNKLCDFILYFNEHF